MFKRSQKRTRSRQTKTYSFAIEGPEDRQLMAADIPSFMADARFDFRARVLDELDFSLSTGGILEVDSTDKDETITFEMTSVVDNQRVCGFNGALGGFDGLGRDFGGVGGNFGGFAGANLGQVANLQPMLPNAIRVTVVDSSGHEQSEVFMSSDVSSLLAHAGGGNDEVIRQADKNKLPVGRALLPV